MHQCLSSDTCTDIHEVEFSTWKEGVGGAGGRKQRLGQDNQTELLQVCAAIVIQPGDTPVRLDMYHLQENQTPSPAWRHSLILLKRWYVLGILPGWHKSPHLIANYQSVLCHFKMQQGLRSKEF